MAVASGALLLPASRTLELRDGRSVRIRPIRPSDAESLRAFDGGLGEASHQFRYHGWMPSLTSERALTMATVDFEERFALVATTGNEGAEAVVADCRMVVEEDRSADVAVAVADGHQDVGLGPALLREMLAVAADHGIGTVVAEVCFGNDHMMHVLRRLGFRRTACELGVVTFTAATALVTTAAARHQ